MSKAVSFLLAHHEYPLMRQLLADVPVDHLVLELPVGWQAHVGSLAGIFDGVAIPHVTLKAQDTQDADAVLAGQLPHDLIQMACRMIQRGMTQALSVLGTPAPSAIPGLADAMAWSGLTAVTLMPGVGSRGPGTEARHVQPLMEALARCEHLSTLSVDAAALTAPAFTPLLRRGKLVELAVDFSIPTGGASLDEATLKGKFSALKDCTRIETLRLSHSPYTGAQLIDCIFAPLAGSASIRAVVVSSIAPLWGSGKNADVLARALECMNSCPNLHTFRFNAPPLARRYLPAVLNTIREVPVEEKTEIAKRLQTALANTQLRTLAVQGQMFPRVMALGFCQGVGASTTLTALDLFGCTFIVNDIPELIVALSANTTLALVPPAPDTLLFRLTTGLSLLYPNKNGEWGLYAELPNEPFAKFDQGGDAFVKSLPAIMPPWTVRRLRRARDPQTRQRLIRIQAAFMALVVDHQRGRLSSAMTDPRAFVDPAAVIVDDATGAGFLPSILRLTEVSSQVAARLPPAE
jgi:hypothetical protein